MHCTKMHHFCGLKSASCHAICIYCIIHMHLTHASCMLHLTHNHHCIYSAQGSLTHNISGIFFPLHNSSQGSLTHNIAYLRSLSHCIVTTYQGISIPLHIMGSQ